MNTIDETIHVGKEKEYSYNTLEESILLLLKKNQNAEVTIGEIFNVLSEKGRSFILIFLSLPFCQPLQIPGFSTPFGLIIAFFGLRMAFGKVPWFPQKILSKKISTPTFEKWAKGALKWAKKLRFFARSRLDWCCHNSIMQILNGLMIASQGIFLALPLPIPFSNLLAAWCILLISLGILEDDGLLILIGYLIAILSILLIIIVTIEIFKFVNYKI